MQSNQELRSRYPNGYRCRGFVGFTISHVCKASELPTEYLHIKSPASGVLQSGQFNLLPCNQHLDIITVFSRV